MRQKIIMCLNKLGILRNRYLKFCFRYDCSKYEQFSGIDTDEQETIAAQIRIICHTIEKALSLSNCRADFGKQKIENLIRLYNEYNNSYSIDKDAVELCKSILHTYYLHRVANNLDISFIPKEFHHHISNINSGAQEFVLDPSLDSFKNIAFSRHSIRNYAPVKVKEFDIEKAIKIAQTAPSACNRQATRIYACLSPEKIQQIKKAHGGIRTFGIPGVIFAITQDLNMYLNEYERNTWLVDGGIFCMNMLYSLQSVGIVSCPVIWGGMKDEDERIASILRIPNNERVVILIVGGYPPEEKCKTPYSAKRPIEDILHIVN